MDVSALTKLYYSDEYCDSLEVYCQKCISSTQQALHQVTIIVLNTKLQVANLMVKLENCENLFPSSRHLVDTNQSWGDKEFKMRLSKYSDAVILMIRCAGLRYSACGTTSLGSCIRKWTSWDTFLLVNCLSNISFRS